MNCLSEHGKNVLLLREILKKSACILLTISAFALIAKQGRCSSQNLNINQISEILLANPPVVRESLNDDLAERKHAFTELDRIFHSDADIASNGDVVNFFHSQMEKVLNELRIAKNERTPGIHIWKTYNQGFIATANGITIAFDLVSGSCTRHERFKLSDHLLGSLVDEIDILFISHKHTDHADRAVANLFKQGNKPVVSPPGIWQNSEELYEYITHPDRSSREIQVANLSGQRRIEYSVYPGHQHEVLNNHYLVTLNGVSMMHTGDQSTNPKDDDVEYAGDRAWLEEFSQSGRVVDILLPNIWSSQLVHMVESMNPTLIIPGHENELGHLIRSRVPYGNNLDRTQNLLRKVVQMTWGEKIHVSHASELRASEQFQAFQRVIRSIELNQYRNFSRDRVLLRHLNLRHQGQGLLHRCARNSRNRLARDLVAAQINPLVLDAENLRADQVTTGSGLTHEFLQVALREFLFNAIRVNNKGAIIEYLNTDFESTISNIADPETGDGLLHFAARYSREGIFKKLKAAGANIFKANNEGKRADQLTSGQGMTHDAMQLELRVSLFNAIRDNNRDVIENYLNSDVESTISSIVDPETGDTLLHAAVKNSRLWISERLVAAGADIFKKNTDGNRPDQLTSSNDLTHNLLQNKLRTTLLNAISDNDRDVIEKYVATNVESTISTVTDLETGDSLLHSAAKYSRHWISKKLVEAGANIFKMNRAGNRPDQESSGRGRTYTYLRDKLKETLVHAIENNLKPTIETYLLTDVASTISIPVQVETNHTLLHLTAVHSRRAIAGLLVNAGANLFKINTDGKTPSQETSGRGLTHDYLNSKTRKYQELLTAITSGTNSDFWELFNTLEPDVVSHPVNQAGDTPLHLAAVNSRKWIANKLVQAGADIFKMNDAGKRADQLTSGSGLTHKFLNSKFKETLANAIEQNHKPTMVNYLKTDVASTITMAITAETNHTMLHLTAIHSRRAIAELLVSAGANLFKINTAGKRPDQETSGGGLTHRYLTGKTREYLALRTAVTSGTNSEFRRLFSAQNHLVIRHPVNQNGDTLLHIAAENSRCTVSEILIGAGADILQTNDRGKRAHELTSGTGHTHRYLLDLYQRRR